MPLRLWRERLSARLVAAVLGMSLLCAVLLTGYSFRKWAGALETQIGAMGNSLATTIAFTWGDAIITEDTPALESFAKHLLAQPEVLIAFVRIERADGKVLNPDSAPRAEQVAAFEAREFSVPVLLRPENRVLGRCSIWLDVAPWRAQLRERAISSLLQNFVCFSLIATVMTLLLRSWLGGPLSKLDDAVQRIASGDLDARVTPTGVAELRRFASTLDAMRESLRDSHASLAQQNVRLRELDRLKNEFLANTSHEIRTPLSSILGGIDLLDDASPADRDELLDAMRRNSAHLLFLINQILDFSKLQAENLCVEPQDVELQPLLADVLSCLLPQAKEKSLELRLDAADDVPARVHTDPLRLRQILINLLGNAIKFTSTGSVTLRARTKNESAPTLVLTVIDTGPGIRDEVLQRLFVPFAQGDSSLSRQHGGTGLGLVISRQLARALGGDITIHSEVGVGTQLVITLPVGVTGATPSAAPTPQTTPAAIGAGGRVLLVDDAPDNRRLLSTMLRKTGVEVATAVDGEQGCRKVAEATANGEPFDLVLMDIQMPVLDGHAAARRLRAAGCTVPLVALTAHATEHDREICMEAGFDGYATKPITRVKLQELVERYAGRRA